MFNHQNRRPPILQLRGATDAVLGPEELGGEIKNFVRTDEGTLRTVVGPAFYQDVAASLGAAQSVFTDGDIEGVFSHRLQSGRSILLAQYGQGIYEHQGWRVPLLSWRKILSGAPPYTAGPAPGLMGQPLRQYRSPDFLTQFVGTPAGVIIIPQDDDGYGRALFYDGDFLAPLGFSEAPSPPHGSGPGQRSSGSGNKYEDGGNGSGYYVSMNHAIDNDAPSGQITMPPVYGPNRLGTVSPNATNSAGLGAEVSNPHGGEMSGGEWRCKAQYQDRWGNRSPLSGPSNGVLSYLEENLSVDRSRKDLKRSADRMKIQISWQLSESAPPGHYVVGTNLYRTQDLGSSGDAEYYHLFDYATSGQLVTTTIPGTVAKVYPDNIPDAWLVSPAMEVEAMPEFKVACYALGRLWIGNIQGDPGRIQPSMAGLPGTMQANRRIYPDTSNEITALHTVPGGFLAFTRSSCFFLRPDDNGGVSLNSISSKVGCVSPDSVATMLNGAVIWLGVEGFYGWAPGDVAPTPLGQEKKLTFSRINRTWDKRACALVDSRTGEYRCWVPMDNSTTNNLCLVFNGETWSTRDDVNAQAVCAVSDQRRYSLAFGTLTAERQPSMSTSEVQSVYVLDHDKDSVYRAASGLREAVIETAWMRTPVSDTKAGVARLLVLLRETVKEDFKVEVFRDWRERPIQTYNYSDSQSPLKYPDDDEASYWGTAEVGGTLRRITLEDYRSNPHGTDSVRWDVRRPFWQKVELYIPSCECFKVRLTFKGDAEFVGLKYVEISPQMDIGHTQMPGGRT